MNDHTPPVLYSADLSGCAAIPHLTESEISEIFAMVLQSAGATIVHAHSHGQGGTAMTCAVILSESHARLKALEAIRNLQRLLGAGNTCVQEMRRGARPPGVSADS